MFALLLMAGYATAGRTFVLVAGVSNYQNSSADLPTTTNDAKRVAKVWQKHSKDVSLITSRYATHEKLLSKLILASSSPGDTVFDPFLGSGSTSVVAKKLGRHYLGIEQSERYCSWAEARLEQAETDKRIQGFEDGVFWERNSGKR